MSKDTAVPARYMDTDFRFFEQIGVDVSEARLASHVTAAQLTTMGAMLSTTELQGLLQHLCVLSNFKPDFFLKGGKLFKFGSHEMLGYAMLSSPTTDHA